MRLADFGQTMRNYRAEHRMTQEELADKLGVQTKHISFLENGHRNPGPDLQKKMEDLLIADEMRQALRRDSSALSEEELEVQLKIFHKLSRLQPVQKEKALELIYSILDAMVSNEKR